MSQAVWMMLGWIDGMKKVGGNESTPKKPTHTVFVHHKAHVAWAGIDPTTPSTIGEHSTNFVLFKNLVYLTFMVYCVYLYDSEKIL